MIPDDFPKAKFNIFISFNFRNQSIIECLLQQIGEKIDRIRLRAGQLMMKFLYQRYVFLFNFMFFTNEEIVFKNLLMHVSESVNNDEKLEVKLISLSFKSQAIRNYSIHDFL